MFDMIRDAVRYWKNMEAGNPVGYYLTVVLSLLLLVLIQFSLLQAITFGLFSSSLGLLLAGFAIDFGFIVLFDKTCGWEWLMYIFDYSLPPDRDPHINWGGIQMFFMMYGVGGIWFFLPFIQYVVGAVAFVCSLSWLANTSWYPYHWCWYSMYLVVSVVTMIDAWFRMRDRFRGEA